MTSLETLHSAQIGDFLWGYYCGKYASEMETSLCRVIERPFEDATKCVTIRLQYGEAQTDEKIFSGEEKEWRFAPCTQFDAERWLNDNAIEAKIRKKVAESEVNYKTALGYGNVFAAMIGAPQASLTSVEQVEEDEIPF